MAVSTPCLPYCSQEGSHQQNIVAFVASFHQNFVKSGLVDPELGQLYDRLFDNRQKGDYADLVRFDPNEVRDWYDEEFEFVETVQNIVKKELDGHRWERYLVV